MKLATVTRLDTDGPASWTPVECLQSLLGEINSGKVDASRLAIIYCSPDGKIDYRIAGPGTVRDTVGLIQFGLFVYMQDCTNE